jgi:hypothetical protein
MAKDELLPAEGKTDATKIKSDPKKKKNMSEKKLKKKQEHDSFRINMFIRQKTEEVLRTGMTIRDLALKAQGFNVKEDEDKSEKYELDLYKHAKEIENGEISYPSRAPSVGRSVSSHHPVRAVMRKFTRKTITKVIARLEEEVRNEEARKKVDQLIMMSFSRNDPSTRRAKAIMQKIQGYDAEIMRKKYQPIVQRQEKLCFLHPQRQNSAVTASKDRASSRAKAIMHNSLVHKS